MIQVIELDLLSPLGFAQVHNRAEEFAGGDDRCENNGLAEGDHLHGIYIWYTNRRADLTSK